MIAFLAVLLLQEPREQKENNAEKKELLKAVQKTFFNGSILKWVVLFSAVIYIFAQGAFYFYQPYLKLSGIDLVYFGMIFATFSIVASIGSKFAYKIEKRLGSFGVFMLIAFLVGGSLIAMGLYAGVFSILFIYAQQFVRMVKSIVVEDLINKETSSEYRATMLSMESLVRKLLIAIALPFLGYLGDCIGIQATLSLMGVATLLFTLPIIFLIKKENIIKN
jgi:hypothetical protein